MSGWWLVESNVISQSQRMENGNGRTKGNDSIAMTLCANLRGNSSSTYEAERTRDEGVNGAPNDNKVDKGVSLGESDL